MALDTYGRKFDDVYQIITDPSFEKRLKLFDRNLKLVFDQQSKRWVILEWALDGSDWNIILKAEDKEGNTRPLGQWVFNTLFAYRQNYIAKREMGADKWFESLAEEANTNNTVADSKASKAHQEQILDDIVEWRKAAREFDGGCANDVTAGYQYKR